MLAGDCALPVRDRPSVSCHMHICAWVMSRLQCTENGRSVSLCISPEADCPFITCYEKAECEKEQWTLVRRCDRQELPEDSLSLIVFSCPFIHSFFSERCHYWAHDWKFEPCLPRHVSVAFAGWHIVKCFATTAWHRPSQYLKSKDGGEI